MIVCNIDEEGRFGGPERRIVLVAEGLTKYSVNTLILIPKMDSEKFESEILRRRIPYKKLSYSRLTLEFRKLLRYVIMFPIDLVATALTLRKHRFDLVHVNGSYQFRSAIAASLARKKIVWHVNDAKMHWLVKAIFHILAPRISDAFIFSSNVARDYYFPQGLDTRRFKTAMITPPVQVERFICKQYGELLPAAGDSISVVTVTGINPDKGVEYFIEAAAMVHAAAPNVSFRVAAAIHDSHSSYFAQLKKMVRDKGLSEQIIRFVGFVDDIPKFLLEGDIFLYTSNTEAGPVAVWEAMAAGLPVVTTNVGAIPEYLEDGQHALIAPPRDARRLADLTLRLVRDARLRAELGRSGRKKVSDCLSVDAAARKHANLYIETINNA